MPCWKNAGRNHSSFPFLEPKGPISSGRVPRYIRSLPAALRICFPILCWDILIICPFSQTLLLKFCSWICGSKVILSVLLFDGVSTYIHILCQQQQEFFLIYKEALGKYLLLQLSYLAASGKQATRLPFLPSQRQAKQAVESTTQKQTFELNLQKALHRISSRRGSLRILTCGPNGFCCPSATKCCFLCCSRHVSCDGISIQDKNNLAETCVRGGYHGIHHYWIITPVEDVWNFIWSKSEIEFGQNKRARRCFQLVTLSRPLPTKLLRASVLFSPIFGVKQTSGNHFVRPSAWKVWFQKSSWQSPSSDCHIRYSPKAHGRLSIHVYFHSRSNKCYYIDPIV